MRRCLILGDAASVYDDAEAAQKLFTPDAIFATNNIGLEWPHHVDFWCTLHPGKCVDWLGMQEALAARLRAGRNKPELWGHNGRGGIPNRTNDWGGSTGLLAVKVAREKQFDRIVLAGVPLTQEGAHYYSRHKQWSSANMFRRAWRRRIAMLGPYVRSMSGWTRELLGEPTREWLECSGDHLPVSVQEVGELLPSVSAA